MGFSVTYPTLSDPIDKSEIETNFSDITGKSGNLVTSDLSASAAIAPTQLSHNLIETWVSLQVRASDFAGGWTNAVNGGILDICPYPGSDGDEDWDDCDVQWVCTDTGAGSATYSIQFGSVVTGAWVGVATIDTGTILNTPGADGNFSRVEKAAGWTSSGLAFTTTPRSIALLATNVEATTLTTAGSFFRVTIALRRKLQSS